MADVRIRKVNLVLDTAGSDQDVVIQGFGTPKAATIEISQGTTLDGNTNHMRGHFGMTDFTTSLAFSAQSQNSSNTSNANVRRRSGRFVYQLVANGNTVDAEATVIAIPDGIRISWTDAPTAANQAIITLYGGNDLQASVDELASSGTSGVAASVTGLDFEPDALIMYSPGLSFPSGGGTSADSIIGLGFATNEGSIVQRMYLHTENDNQSQSAIAGLVRTDRIMSSVSSWTGGDTAVEGPTLEVTAFNSDGFTITQRDSSAFAVTGAYLSLNFGGGNFSLTSASLGTDTTGNKAVTSPGFEPDALLCIATSIDFADIGTIQDADSTGGRWSLGGATRLDEFGIRGTVDDAENNTDTRASTHTHLAHIRFFAGSTDYELDWVSFDTNGYTVNVTSASTADKAVIILAIEATGREAIEYLRPYEHTPRPNTSLRR